MSQPETPKKQLTAAQPATKATLYLIGFQVLGMLIPILTLPILARALGVEVFGQLMLAQSLVFLAVILLDAGFNTESQRFIALADTNEQANQILLDNLLARSVFSIPVVAVLLLTPYFFPLVSYSLILFSLPLVLGTLLLPQWWLIALHKGRVLGIFLTLGRVLSAIAIVLLVGNSSDVIWAALASSSATFISGLLLWIYLYKDLQLNFRALNYQSWKSYFQVVKTTIFSGFFSSASASVPVLFLSHFSGTTATGLFSAADRLTRAAAYVLSFIEQTLMTRIAKVLQSSPAQAQQETRKLLQVLCSVLTLGALFNYFIAPWVVEFLYGSAFYDSVAILQILGAWLALYGIRKAMLTFWWSANGQLSVVAKFQWTEAGLIFVFSALGAYAAGAIGLSIALLGIEILLILLMLLVKKRG